MKTHCFVLITGKGKWLGSYNSWHVLRGVSTLWWTSFFSLCSRCWWIREKYNRQADEVSVASNRCTQWSIKKTSFLPAMTPLIRYAYHFPQHKRCQTPIVLLLHLSLGDITLRNPCHKQVPSVMNHEDKPAECIRIDSDTLIHQQTETRQRGGIFYIFKQLLCFFFLLLAPHMWRIYRTLLL